MVFFNYSTMQMTAKVVYYGPGLCGKTTNLQYIYGHTSNDSRGEMVSLETESDRTLFFDLLPIDVGSIGGFNTRIQLYTVPGQVFYNTTRKLVLKGVDGVVFVADSQKPMLKANIESLKNLEANLAEMGLTLDSMPIVLQYNKRDLPDVTTVEELNRSINNRSWPTYEASATSGLGVFDTLKGISKLTLISLKKRLTKTEPKAAAPTATTPGPRLVSPLAKPADRAAKPVVATPKARPGKVDVLAELERLRKQTLRKPAPTRRAAPAARPTLAAPAPTRAPAPSLNGKGEIHRSVELTLRRPDFQRARRFLLNLRVEDDDSKVVDAIRDLPIEISDPTDLERVLLHLNVALRSKD
jgi:signal recognition particle receptor subunit beta